MPTPGKTLKEKEQMNRGLIVFGLVLSIPVLFILGILIAQQSFKNHEKELLRELYALTVKNATTAEVKAFVRKHPKLRLFEDFRPSAGFSYDLPLYVGFNTGANRGYRLKFRNNRLIAYDYYENYPSL